MFATQFYKDLSEWKRTRAEYKKLLTGIRAELPRDDLLALADEAGCDLDELGELVNLHRVVSSPAIRERAARFDAAQTQVDELTTLILDAEKRASLAKTNRESDRAEAEAYALSEECQKARDALADAFIAAARVRAATEAGVL